VRVVVVDNDPAALDLAVTDLRLEGHEIVGSGADGAAALELCRTTEPDVLVIDHRMPPGPWGVDVAAVVREEFPHIRVVLYSNYDDPEVIERAQAAGASYLLKGNLRSLRRVVGEP
jgi:DNA-binding NarL/FixJ family response regulator